MKLSDAEIGGELLKIGLSIKKHFPYEKPRENQVNTITKIVLAYLQGKKYYILEAPTGSGKSVIAYTAVKVIMDLYLDTSAVFCTKTKSLQAQYKDSFKDVSSLWSASGYSCELDPFNPEAYYKSYLCKFRICPMYDSCQYLKAKNKFLASSLGTLNYQFMLHARWIAPKILVLDECHSLEDVLSDFLTVKINPSYLYKYIENVSETFDIITDSELKLIKKTLDNALLIRDNIPNWLTSCKNVLGILYSKINVIVSTLETMQDQCENGNLNLKEDERKILFKSYKALNSFKNKLSNVIYDNEPWVISETTNEHIVLKPLYVYRGRSQLTSNAEFVIMMSATICGVEEFTKSLRIHPDNYIYNSLDSTIPVENRQIINVGLPPLSKNTIQSLLPLYLSIADKLIDQYGKDCRGIIHTVSYETAEYIMNNSKHNKRMIIPNSSEMIKIKELMSRSKDTILVSPAAIEGIDLSDDLSRFQILWKVPYPYLGDKWIKSRMELSSNWYARKTVSSIVQAAGRSVRNSNDYAITFILDGAFNKLLQHRELFPEWFLSGLISR